jgi:hypothetical protein
MIVLRQFTKKLIGDLTVPGRADGPAIRSRRQLLGQDLQRGKRRQVRLSG